METKVEVASEVPTGQKSDEAEPVEAEQNETETPVVDKKPENTDDTTESESVSRLDPVGAIVDELVACTLSNVPLPEAGEREMSPTVSEGSVEDNINVATIAQADSTTKETSHKNKRKDDKGIEHVLKALNSLESTEEKLAALCKKYTELLEEHRLLQNKFKQGQKKLTSTSREKEQLQSEQSKTVLAKSKLESLCRELQRHNKLIKDESVARAKEEEEKRKEVTNKFQTTINDIQRQMSENYEKNNKLREENMELASKLKNLIEQYELREQHIEKVFKHKELEQQLCDAKLAQATLQFTEEKERNIQEKQLLLDTATQAHSKIQLLEAQETQLRNQVALYTEKYEEFQSTLAKSNEVFQSFKSEMDKMTKKIKKLEKETTMWRTRWENSNKALLDMAEEKTRSDKNTTLLHSKVGKLESLCRALQEERKKLAARAQGTGTLATLNGAMNAMNALDTTDVKTEKVTESAKTTENKDQPDSAESPPNDIEPTETPPNTPEGGSRGDSRASPVNVHQQEAPQNTPKDSDQSENSNQAPVDQSQADTSTDQSEAVVQGESDQSGQNNITDQSETVTENSNIEDTAEK